VRLALWLAAAVGIVVTAVVFYAYWSHNVLTLRTTELKRQVSVIAAGVAVSDIIPGTPADTSGTRERLLKVEAGIIAARLAVTDDKGTVLFSTAGRAALPSYPVLELAQGPTAFDPRTGVISVPDVGRVLVVAVPVAFSEPNTPSRYLLGVRSLSDMGAADSWVAIAMAAAALVALLVAWLLGTLLTRRVTDPLSRLTEGARDIAAGRWGRQVPVAGDDETAELARAFNDMSARTAATYRAQQALVSDVSHEIRTPVTSISGFASAIADGTLHDTDGIHRAAAIIVSEAGRLAEITAALLSLADLDAGAVTLASESVDVVALGDALRDRFGLVAEQRGVGLEIDLGDAEPVADPARVLQALSTLAENALRYATSAVSVTADVRGDRWIALIDDDGPGVPFEDRERVFGRFTRLDSSRSPGGTGLGLAICRRIVELMGGSVRAESSPLLGGARFVIELPLTVASSQP